MTARLPGWVARGGIDSNDSEELRAGSIVPNVAVERPGAVTGRMIDEAVASVLRQQKWEASTAEVLKYNLSMDPAGDVTQAYYASKVAGSRPALTGVARKDLTIRYVLTDEEVAALTDYAPSFRLRFESRESHDHAAAAACRLIDHQLIRSRLPYGVPTSDIGGNPLVYLRREDLTVHVCGSTVDVKDPMRYKLRQMEAKKIAAASQSVLIEDMANQVTGASDKRDFVCGLKAQECDHQSAVLMSIHVYDIPMEDWPTIMSRKGAAVVEGCVLFSDKFWECSSGELDVTGARYEIDVAANTFRMGFRDSPSWWYQHEWSKYVLYATDQLLYSADATFSYKVTERRGDTLFFRILRIGDGSVPRALSSSYRMPGVPVVEVNGFELADDRAWAQPAIRRKVYHFPASLWTEMVSQASEDFERGVLDYYKMYNHYRTISVRRTISAVLVMGGEQVSAEQLVPLVVHACLAAASMSLLGQRTTRVLTAQEMAGRARATESTVRKVAKVLSELGKSVLLAPLVVFRSLGRFIRNFAAAQLDKWIMDWEPVWQIVRMDSGILFSKHHVPVRGVVTQLPTDASVAYAAGYPFIAASQDPALTELFKRMCPHVDLAPLGAVETPVQRDEPRVATDAEVVGAVSTAPPTYVSEVADDEVQARLEAIREHLMEIDQQNVAVESSCSRAYRLLTVNGAPSVDMLRSRAELYRNPDLWFVESGIVVRSALGLPVSDFHHSAVYTPTADADGGCIRSVHVKHWEGMEAGTFVKRDHHVLADEGYRGWVLVTDDLVVHNGPEIKESLRAALRLDHRYEVRLNQGPPGCGKTRAIIEKVRDTGSDVVMCPVRESALDTRERVIERHPGFPDAKLRVRTVDSYLVGLTYSDKAKALRADTIYADECYMTHAGKWYAAAALLGVRKVEAFGDGKQIPHIVRVQSPALHVKIKGKEESVYVTYRCPASAVAAWGSMYDWKVRSASKVNSQLNEVLSTVGKEIPVGCVMMCMYQADKTTLRKMYPGRKDIKILTANEAEGKTYRAVWLHRFDARKRTDKFSLFDRESHVLVAMSRHTHEFLYVRPNGIGDLVTRWIESSRDRRRLAAAMDLDTAGETMEKI